MTRLLSGAWPRIVALVTLASFIASPALADSRQKMFAFTRGSYAGPATSEFATPVVVVPRGTDLYLFNLNLWGHSMYSDANGTDDRLFWSEEVSFGRSTLINGVSSLPAGSYGFHCSNHPDMLGTLVVVDKGE